jgi:uncharacterized membrane protein
LTAEAHNVHRDHQTGTVTHLTNVMRIHTNLADWERLVSVLAGAGLVAAGARQGRTWSGQGLAGLALIARGVSGYCPISDRVGLASRSDDTRRALAGSGGTKLTESVTIARSRDEVYELWHDLHDLPAFMEGLQRVEYVEPGVTHWVFAGPRGTTLEWDAEIINEIDGALIGWRSLPGADLVSAGSVQFRDAPGGGTEVTVTMQYDPPGGRLGTAVNWMTGWAPASLLREDLRRLKRWLETGETPTTEGQPSGRRSRTFRTMQQVME